MIFRTLFRGHKSQDLRGLSPAKKMFWYIIIFGSCSLAFYYNFNYRMAKIDAKFALNDTQQISTPQEREQIIGLYNLFKKNYSTELVLHLVEGDLFIPKLRPNNLFIGLSTGKDQAMIILPNLINKIIPKEEKNKLEAELLLCKEQTKTNKISEDQASGDQALNNSSGNASGNASGAHCLSKSLESILTYISE